MGKWIEESELLDIPENFKLGHGQHSSFEEGACAMELAAHLAGAPHCDNTPCVDPVIGALVRNWNDSLGDEYRNRYLLPLVPRIVGTKSTPDIEEKRGWMASDWLVREWLPAFLDYIPRIRKHARVLRGLSPILSTRTMKKSKQHIVAAWNAVAPRKWCPTLGEEARARAIIEACAGIAARDAANDVSGDITWEAAKVGIVVAAQAGDVLQSTVEKLQQSAVELIERMISAQ